MNVNLTGHLRGLLHVHIVVEEVLEGGHLAERLQLVSEALLRLRTPLFLLGLRANLGDPVDCLDLRLCVERCLPLVIPELPGCLTSVPARRQELHRFGSWRLQRSIT